MLYDLIYIMQEIVLYDLIYIMQEIVYDLIYIMQEIVLYDLLFRHNMFRMLVQQNDVCSFLAMYWNTHDLIVYLIKHVLNWESKCR